MGFVQKSFSKITTALFTMVLGVLLIIANHSTSVGDYENISTFIGVVCLIVSILSLILECLIALLKKKRFLNSEIASAAFVLSIGIFFVSEKLLAVTIIEFIFEFIPYLFLVFGVLLFTDALATTIRSKKLGYLRETLPLNVFELLLSLLVIVLGAISIKDNTELAKNKFLVFGIILVIYSSAALVLYFFAPSLITRVEEANESSLNINKAEAIDEEKDEEIID